MLKVQHRCFLYSFCTSLDDEDTSNGLCNTVLQLKKTCVNITELSNEVEMNALLLGVEDHLLKLTTCSIPEDLNELMAYL